MAPESPFSSLAAHARVRVNPYRRDGKEHSRSPDPYIWVRTPVPATGSASGALRDSGRYSAAGGRRDL